MSEHIVKGILGGITWSQNALIDKTQALTEAEFCQQPSSTAPPSAGTFGISPAGPIFSKKA